MTLSLLGPTKMREAALLSAADAAGTAWGACQIRLVANRVASRRTGSTHKVYRGWRFAVTMDQVVPPPARPCSRFPLIRHSSRRVSPAMPWCSSRTRASSPLGTPRPSPGQQHRSERPIPSPWGWRRRVATWRPTAGRRTRRFRGATRNPIRRSQRVPSCMGGRRMAVCAAEHGERAAHTPV